MIKMKKKVKLFHDPIRSRYFFSHYCLNFIEFKLNISSLYNEYNVDPRAKGHS